MSDFNPNEDLRVEVTPRDDVFDLRSKGMVDYDRSELTIRGVPESQVPNAGVLINHAAAYIVENEVASGERMGMELGNQMPIVTIFDVGPGVQRIADGHVEADGDEIPRVALTTVALARAAQAFAERDRQGGLTRLREAIEFYPGESLSDAEPYFGYPYNWQNCLVYRELAQHYDGQEGAAYLRKACERSVILQSQILGAPLDAFADMDAARVAKRSAFIHRSNVETFHTEEGPSDMLAITIAPIWELGEDGAVQRSLAMVPAALMEFYWAQEVLEAVDREAVYRALGESVEAF
jgi:hypothetical protein